MPRSMFWAFLGLLLHMQIADGISAKYQQENSSSEEEDSNWQCGTDFITKAMSEGQVETDCPTLKVPINNCCLAHDNCYDQQLGRKYCDDVFCHCLLVATEPAELCFKEDAPLFCSLVRQFGEAAYNASGPLATATPPPPLATTVATAPTRQNTRQPGYSRPKLVPIDTNVGAAQPVQPVQPAQPAQPVRPVQPVHLVHPAGPRIRSQRFTPSN